MTNKDELIIAATRVIQQIPNATRNAREKLKADLNQLDETQLETFIEKQTKDNEANQPKPQPKQIDKTKPPFTVPLKELDVGKAGVSDLFEKQNETIRYLNALEQKPQAS